MAILLGMGSLSMARAGTPAVSLLTAPLVAPSSAWTYYGAATSHTVGMAAWSTIAPEIQAMATSLGANRYAASQISAVQYTQNVFDYVRNNINVEFRFGLGKGGRGALIDQSGTPFDQAELMVKLLRAAGVPAGYQVGTITLTAQQFGFWSGFVTGLNQTNQTFTVNAQAACQFLADGGIPATVNGASSCTSLTGNLTTVTMGHIWVSANSLLYDPAFKQNTLYAGVDLAAAMGCGTQTAPTCGSAAETAAMSGATQSTLAGSPTIQNLNETSLQSKLQTYAVNLESSIKTNLVTAATPYPRLQNVIGGYLRNMNYYPAPGVTLPYASSAQYSWSSPADIPDQFRSTLQIMWTGDSVPLYGDEIAGRGVFFTENEVHWLLQVDGTVVYTSTASCCATPALFKLVVNHPYAANSGTYADEAVDFSPTFAGSSVYEGFSSAVISTIVASFGDSGPSTASHYADLQQSNIAPFVDCSAASPPLFSCLSFRDQHLTTVANFLVQQSAADQVVMNVSSSLTTRHHSVGLSQGSAAAFMTIDSAVSANSTANNAASRQSAYMVITALDATLEGSIYQQEKDIPEGISAPALFHRSNVDGTKFVDIASTQMPTVLSSLTNYSAVRASLLTSMASAGYEFVIPQSGTPSCRFHIPADTTCVTDGGDYAFTGSSSALLIAEAVKGGAGSTVTDPADAPLDTTRRGDYGLFQKKYSSVDLATGALTLSPPADVIAGAGEFPYALPLLRTYSSSGRVGGWMTLEAHGDGGTITADNGYAAPDSFVAGRLGGAWLHNYDIAAEIANDGYEAFGAHGGLPASAAISTIFALYDINKTIDFPHRLTSILSSYWFGSNYLMGHTVLIHKALQVESFQKLPDSTYTPLKNTKAILTQTGLVTAVDLALPIYSHSWGRNDYDAVKFSYVEGDGSILSFNQCRMIFDSQFCGGTIPITSWTFPTGVTVQFNYQSVAASTCQVSGGGPYPCYGGVTMLSSVTNNLGRSLTFTPVSTPVPGSKSPSWIFQISSVTSDSGQTVSYSTSGCVTQYYQTPLCNYFSVTTPDSAVTSYGYAAGSDSPDPTVPYLSENYRLRRVFFPTTPTVPTYTYVYDGKGRIASITDALGFKTTYDPGGLYAELLRRAYVIDATGSVSSSFFDDGASLFAAEDGLGRITAYNFDLSRRKISTVYPEMNTDSYTYDVRSNLLSTTHIPKPGSALTPTTELNTYVEGPTVTLCAYPASCNQVATSTDADANLTTYTYLGQGTAGGTGQLQRVKGPSITAQSGGISGNTQVDYCYTSLTGSNSTTISALSASIQKVDASTNRVKFFGYNSLANHLVLSSSVVDPSASYAPPATAGGTCTPTTKTSPAPLTLTTAYTFDAIGNVHTIDGPIAGTGDTTTYSFDSMRRVTTVSMAPLSVLTRYCYDADGELLSTNKSLSASSDPNSGTATTTGQCSSSYPSPAWVSENRTYWPTGDLNSVTDNQGHTTLYAYDPVGRQQVVQDADGRQTAKVYDLAGEVIAEWRGGSGWINGEGPSATAPTASTAYTPSSYSGTGPFRYESYCNGTDCYSGNGKPHYAIDANNNMTRYQYDGRDRLQFTYFPDASAGTLCTAAANDASNPACTGTQTYEKSMFDAVGNRTSLTTRKGDVIGYHFDAMNRQDSKSPTAQGAVTTGYNLVGEPLNVSKALLGSNPAHTTLYNYDSAGRTLSESNDGRAVTHAYDTLVSANDNAGNRTRTTWPDGYFISYQYDALNRMVDVRENSTATTDVGYYVYDPLSRRKTACLGSTSSSTCPGATSLNRASYSYDSDGQLSSLAQVLNGTTVTLGYGRNHSYQITNLNSTDSFYLPTPAAASSSAYVPNDLNQYASVGGQTSTYDKNGNLLTWYPTSGKQTYTYDSENRLITAAVAGSGTATISYDYDGLGRRASKAVSGTLTSYLLDGDEEIAEYTSAGTLLRRYITGPGVDDRIAHAEGSATANPTKTYYHTNHQGSVIAMTDGSGNVAQRVGYDEYGNGSLATGEQFGYTGRRYDPETGLYYYRARYYSPQIGRFLQVDPAGYKDNLDLYTYVGNDPLDHTDPTGKCFWDACVVEGAAAAALVDAAVYVGTAAAAAWGAHEIIQNSSKPSDKPAAAPGDKPKDSTLKPGEHAGDSIPARGPDRDFTPEEREKINEIGGSTGCHTCGTTDPGTKSGNFIPDHQPPSALNPDDAPQRLYPQCIGCSRTQGGQVNGAKSQQPQTKSGAFIIRVDKIGETQ